MNTLKIPQREEKRFLVLQGREMHEKKLIQNKDYLRKKIGCIDKKIDVYLSSEKLKLVGRVDEVLFFENNCAAPLDYKYAYWEGKIYKTLKMQQTLYALLIEDILKASVSKAYLVYIRSQNHVEEIKITEIMKKMAKLIVDEIFDILNINYYPKGTKDKKKCLDCTYRNLCKL